MTGVPTTTLRAWERRYGLLNPSRTPKGHRLYSAQDIELVREIVKLLKSNHTISEAIRITRNPELGGMVSTTSEDHWQSYQQRILKSIENFNDQNLDRTYNEALSIYPVDMVNEHVIIPVLQTLGNSWTEKPAGIAEEHFFSAFLRNKLGARLHHDAHRARGRKVFISCLPGESHELGILLFSLALLGHGYQVLYLGGNLPLQQIPLVAERTEIDTVLLSGTRTDLWNPEFKSEMAGMISTLSVPILLGGEFSSRYENELSAMGIQVLGSDHVDALEKIQSLVPAFKR
jgi:DNA-binding transcriptional MerR regulator